MLLHAGGLRGAHADDDGTAREPQVTAGAYSVPHASCHTSLQTYPSRSNIVTAGAYSLPRASCHTSLQTYPSRSNIVTASTYSLPRAS